MTQYIEFELRGRIPITDEMIADVECHGEDPEDSEALIEAFQGYGDIMEYVEVEDYYIL